MTIQEQVNKIADAILLIREVQDGGCWGMMELQDAKAKLHKAFLKRQNDLDKYNASLEKEVKEA